MKTKSLDYIKYKHSLLILKNLYLSFLNRSPDDLAVKTYTNRISTGEFNDVVHDIKKSSEFRQKNNFFCVHKNISLSPRAEILYNKVIRILS